VDERDQDVLWFAPISVLLFVIAATILVALGPSLGGVLGDAHGALRGLLAGEDQPIADNTISFMVPRGQDVSVPVLPIPTIPSLLSLSPTPTPTLSVPCAWFAFQGALDVRDGHVSFGRFNLVADTAPYGRRDPLVAWKLIQFDSIEIDLQGAQPALAANAAKPVEIPVGQTVGILISDPFTKESLLSARWHITSVEVLGDSASINAGLEANLSDIRVNNAIESPTLACLATAEAGVLTLQWEYGRDVALALAEKEPLYAAMSGTVHAAHCLR
jgi:hypothetical protein